MDVNYHEDAVRKFAAEFDTPNTRRMIAAAEAGLITWTEAYGLAVQATQAALEAEGAA
jgi:hypothetical protein